MSKRIWRQAQLAALIAATAMIDLFPGRAGAQTVTEFTPPGAVSTLSGIATGPDGALWYARQTTNKIGRMTTAGTFTEFDVPTPASTLYRIAAGTDGNLWFTEFSGNKIGRVTPSGTFAEFPLATAGSDPIGITQGPDDNIWFTEYDGNRIGRITPAGVITEFTIPTAASGPYFITAGPDGNVWFSEFNGNKIGKITTAGTFTEFTIPTAGSGPAGIVAGPDGALWFGEVNGNKIGRITTAGVVTEFAIPTAGSLPYAITAGPDGALWFSENATNKVGRMTVAGAVTNEVIMPTAASGPFILTIGPDNNLWLLENNIGKIAKLAPTPPAGPSPLVASILPTSRSVQVGSTATVFATIANATNNPQTQCRIAVDPSNYVPGFFSYQTTNPATNALSGTPNTSAPISAQGLQTYVLAIKAGAAMPPTNVKLVYICDGVAGATPIVGINTWLLTFDTNPVADMIAVGVTPSNDGFSHTGGNSGTGVFAVATTNIGPATVLTATPRLSDTSLPLTVTICETNSSAACKAPPAATVSRSFGNNEASTFSIFLKANGAITPDPATKRVFLEFLDGGSVVRGSTSTAVTTQ